MTETEIKDIIQQQLPQLISNDPLIRDFILRTVSEYYAPKQETESKFDRILEELQRDREEQARKWDENNRRLDEFMHQQNLKWDENNRKWNETLEQIKKLDKKYDSTIGALGSRWGLYSEASFRNALKGILEDSFGVQVLNVNEFDDEGEVFGRPDQVEIDVIVKNGLLILCEIKSSIDKAGMYIFDRKVAFYEKRHQRKANRKMVICPMVDDRAKPVAQNLGIELYSYADSVELS
ncbi:PD-(D/E)XK nuclease family protein [Geminocystis sp. CENA526]|uniref:PD-(D/E)XK nuclease family protein n=1 Tax=Geminocystis sp. CENA526 TaxID=1355871 RepID=UPI003D6DF5F9